jgi:protein TonB
LPEARDSALIVAGLSIAGLIGGAAYLLSDSDRMPVRRTAHTAIQVSLASSSLALQSEISGGQAHDESSNVHRTRDMELQSPSDPRQAGQVEPVDAAFATTAPSTSPEGPGDAPTVGWSTEEMTANLSFQRELLAHIAAYRRYPDAARAARLNGVVNVRFAIDRDGGVLDVWVQDSSGHPALDQEAIDTIRRAQPMPIVPPILPSRIDLVLPIEFSISSAG